MRLVRSWVMVVWVVAAAIAAHADDAYFSAPVTSLTIVEGALPAPNEGAGWDWRAAEMLRPYVWLEGEGEAYAEVATGNDGGPRFNAWSQPWSNQTGVVVARVPAGSDASGWLFVPNETNDRLVGVRFMLPASKAAASASRDFYEAKAAHYDRLRQSGAPGTAWFRYQADQARKRLGTGQADDARAGGGSPRGGDLDDTYDLFAGGRAVSENLQLSRELPPAPRGQTGAPAPDGVVPVGSIEGISVRAIDWAPLIKDASPTLDRLAAAIPADQHAVFFPSFESLSAVLNETRERGLPVFRTMAARSEDARVLDRYERQLGLSPRGLAALLGPAVVKSVAITGSDPYFETGTDVAVVIEAADAQALRALVLAQIRLSTAKVQGVEPKSGQVEGANYDGFVSADRAVCSYVAAGGGFVVVTNSLEQLRRLAAVQHGSAESLAALPEYRFFRMRYPLGDKGETAFAFLSDATIRRWCGPAWRIGASRRLRAAAVLSDVTAAHMPELGAGVKEPRRVEPEVPMRTIGEVTVGPAGVRSSVYGSIEFLTPIVELGITEVAADEAEAYKRWRDGYQRNWSWAFDPIGARVGVAPERLSADVTVMPLIVGTEYRSFVSIAQGAKIEPGAGDPHDDAAHFVMAVNRESLGVKQGSGFLRMMAPGVDVDPLGWLGQSAAIYADKDPFWGELAAAKDRNEFMEKQVHRLPVGVHAEVSSALKLTAFLAAVRGMVEQAAPGMTAWDTRRHGEQAYVRVGLSENAKAESRGEPFENIGVYYAATPRSLVVSLNEGLLKRAMDRGAAQGKEGLSKAGPWLGEGVCLRVSREGVDVVDALRDGAGGRVRQACWESLPILNEWKRLFPKEDPVAVHERWWGVRLVCPGGGKYVWNEKFKTMESTVYESPGEPKEGPRIPSALDEVTGADFGLTFEQHGLRAKGEIERKATKVGE